MVFINFRTSRRDRASQWLFSEFPLVSRHKFSSEKDQSIFRCRSCLSLVKSFAERSFLLSLMAYDKNWRFLILNGKYRMSLCTSCLIRNKYSYVLGHGPDYLIGSLSVIALILPTNSGVLFSPARSERGF